MNRKVNNLMKIAETAKTTDGKIVFPGNECVYAVQDSFIFPRETRRI